MRPHSLSPQQALTQLYLLLLSTAFLFFCGPSGYSRITGSKFQLFALLAGSYVALSALLGAAGLLRRRQLPSLGRALRRTSWPQRFAAAYLLATWLSALLSPHWPDTLAGVSRYEGAGTITLYVLSFLLISATGRPTRLVLGVLAAAMTAFGVVCTLQLAGGNPFGLYPEGLGYADAYVAYPGAYLGTLGNVGLVAAFLSLTLPMLAYALLRLSGRPRFLLAIPLALCLYVLVEMDVLAGFVGVGMGCLLAAPVAGLRKKSRRRAAAIGLGGAMLAALALVYWADMGSGLFHEVHQILHGNLDDSFGTGRVYIWKQVLARVPEALWLGHGPDTMLRAGMEFRHYNSLLGREAVSRIDTAHNELLNVLYHQGLLGLGAYLAFGLALLARWVRRAADEPPAALLGAGLLGYALQSMFGFSMVIAAPFFWAAAGLLMCTAGSGPAEGELPWGPGGSKSLPVLRRFRRAFGIRHFENCQREGTL